MVQSGTMAEAAIDIPQPPSGDGPALRPPSTVMRLARLGSFHPTRISFVRTLVRRMARERWRFSAPIVELDDDGFGTIVYEIATPAGIVSFAAFSNYLAPDERTDRVIAEKWDAAFALVDGRVTRDDAARLRANAPLQEAGRFSARELVLSRANKSVRLFETMVEALAAGRQPDMADVVEVGYLMRTTAVYGNGKFGIADLDQVRHEGVFSLPYQAEMLTVYMARQLSFDLAEHIARRRNPNGAVPLDRRVKRALGVGNATGLGMAPFLVNHPQLLNAWIMARETALARVRAEGSVAPDRIARFCDLLDRAIGHAGQWNTDDTRQAERIAILRKELADLRDRLAGDAGFLPEVQPWDFLAAWAEARSLELSEMVNSLLTELYPELVDELENSTGADDREESLPAMTLRALKALIERNCDWAIARSYDGREARHFFWYRSAEKDEPRLGERFSEPGADKEQPLGIGFLVASLYAELCGLDGATLDQPVAAFLLGRPRWRGIVRRIQSLADCPYGEVRDNLLGQDCLAVDLLRCKLSIFGAGKFDPKSDRWTRITLFQGAPLLEGLDDPAADDWSFPYFPLTAARV